MVPDSYRDEWGIELPDVQVSDTTGDEQNY
jgi:hypothetical protein